MAITLDEQIAHCRKAQYQLSARLRGYAHGTDGHKKLEREIAMADAILATLQAVKEREGQVWPTG